MKIFRQKVYMESARCENMFRLDGRHVPSSALPVEISLVGNGVEVHTTVNSDIAAALMGGHAIVTIEVGDDTIA